MANSLQGGTDPLYAGTVRHEGQNRPEPPEVAHWNGRPWEDLEPSEQDAVAAGLQRHRDIEAAFLSIRGR